MVKLHFRHISWSQVNWLQKPAQSATSQFALASTDSSRNTARAVLAATGRMAAIPAVRYVSARGWSTSPRFPFGATKASARHLSVELETASGWSHDHPVPFLDQFAPRERQFDTNLCRYTHRVDTAKTTAY